MTWIQLCARRLRTLPPLLGLVAALAHAQPAPERWEPLDGLTLGADVSAVQVDRRGLLQDVANLNRDDGRPYPLVRVLVDLAKDRSSGLGDSYRSLVTLVALDCAGRRAQDIQTRLFEKPGGRSQTMVMGVLSAWSWDDKGRTHPAMANALFARYCR